MDESARTSLYVRETGTPPVWPTLAEPLRTDVAVIGGGFTGLSTALHLAEGGTDVALLEAETPGWGASGRNGGQLNPGLKYDPAWFLKTFGPTKGREIVDFGWSTVDTAAALIDRLGIDCDLRRGGTIRAAATGAEVATIRQSFDDMAALGMPVDWVEGAELAAMTGHDHYPAAFVDRRGGDVNPLALARGLARAAADAGAQVFGQSRVSALARHSDGWRLEVNGHEVIAGRVLVACNGYADDLIPGLKQASVPVFSSILATPPLPEELASRILPGRQVLYEAGLVTVYYRVDAQNRLVIGGRGAMRPSGDAATMQAVSRHAHRLWPGVAQAGWGYAWNGRVAITSDHLPHLHAPAPGLLIAYGYNGRGVALSNALGIRLAAALAPGGDPAGLPLPLSDLRRIPFHRFWRIGAQAAILNAQVRRRLGI
ncbi:NAD(P)/FAD-dependent oxidoreductase [Acidimangrovimonas sediminis]|uniref:NAD(P)/FAD-dependent oxidoreductase n=1 Tax=Acidimangrovimonas sediminis TaxID=2056283 RepID=UPI000C8070A1|nr:FAD-binding oxidoreductase [Acidimangrovimonas sediminis]